MQPAHHPPQVLGSAGILGRTCKPTRISDLHACVNHLVPVTTPELCEKKSQLSVGVAADPPGTLLQCHTYFKPAIILRQL